MTAPVLKVGIIGQGRSGRGIHGQLLAQIPDRYRIAAVADAIPERQETARQEYGCNAYATWEEMVESEQLDLVVNASPSHQHFEISLALLERGINVLCEKPLAKTAEEVDRLIEASQRSGKVLAVFQQSRYQPAFVKLREVIESGVLGRIVQISITFNGFARRWDWQTLQSNNGGNLLNTGPHPVDQALQLFGDADPEVVCMMDRANTFGDAEDYVKLILRGQGHPVIDIEISSCDAYPRDMYVIQGTRGGLRGNTKELEWRYFNPEEAPEQKLIREPMFDAQGRPAYCSEQLTWHKDNWELALPENRVSGFDFMTEQLYNMLHKTISSGAELEITPQQVRRQMAVMEECRRQNPQIYMAE